MQTVYRITGGVAQASVVAQECHLQIPALLDSIIAVHFSSSPFTRDIITDLCRPSPGLGLLCNHNFPIVQCVCLIDWE